MGKGQSAVEFFVTYGWAILVLVIVTGILLSSGILTPNYLVSEECTFGNNFMCSFALFNEGGSTKLLLEVHNGFPYKVKIKDISVKTRDGTQQFSFTTKEAEVESGGIASFEGKLGGTPMQEGVIKRFSGNITFVSCAPEIGPDCSTNQHGVTGRIIGKLIPE